MGRIYDDLLGLTCTTSSHARVAGSFLFPNLRCFFSGVPRIGGHIGGRGKS